MGLLFVALLPGLAGDLPTIVEELGPPRAHSDFQSVRDFLRQGTKVVALDLARLRRQVVHCYLPCPFRQVHPHLVAVLAQVVVVSYQRLVFCLQVARYPSQVA